MLLQTVLLDRLHIGLIFLLMFSYSNYFKIHEIVRRLVWFMHFDACITGLVTTNLVYFYFIYFLFKK